MLVLGKQATWYDATGPGGCIGILAWGGRLVRIDDTLSTALLALVPPASSRATPGAWDDLVIHLIAAGRLS